MIYALGGGLGHLQRSLSLAKAAATRGHSATILSNSPAYGRICDRIQFAGVRVVQLPSDKSLVTEVRRWLQRDDHDVFVVDTFPRGVLGELPDMEWRMPACLVHRDLKVAYATRPDVVGCVPRFDLMLCPGERGPLEHRRVIETVPWVLLDAGELLARREARVELGCMDSRPVVVVCDTADPAESAGLGYLAKQLSRSYGDAAHVLRADLERTWPLMRLHLGVDLLIGAAGYNTVHEARSTRTPLRAIARERLYDCQDRRLRPDEVLDEVTLPSPITRSPDVCYVNGAHDAVRSIEELVGA